MRIISDFRDYYDAVQATGQDQTLIYTRKREEIKLPDYVFPAIIHPGYFSHQFTLHLEQHIVGFCGKVYPVLELAPDSSSKPTICQSLDEVDRFVEQHFRKAAVEEYVTKPAKRRWWWHYWPRHIRRDAFEKYFTSCADKKNSFAGIFLEKACPIFVATRNQYRWGVVTGGTIAYNACLKKLEFFRLFDTFTAFQEIAMFLGGLAVPLKDIPKVPDKIMVGIKGFDKWSFRKPPREK
jgi:hypothetical protein